MKRRANLRRDELRRCRVLGQNVDDSQAIVHAAAARNARAQDGLFAIVMDARLETKLALAARLDESSSR